MMVSEVMTPSVVMDTVQVYGQLILLEENNYDVTEVYLWWGID